jgi:hypothetical protein
LRSIFRSLLIFFATLFMLAVPAVGQGEAAPDGVETPWQEVISSQIQAFRDRDAPGAFMYAGAAFHVQFPNAETFFEIIMGSGYSPIMDSTSHSFGEYRMVGTDGVIQQVRLTGNNQELYGALYQLTEEEGGWRVQGVQLYREQGVAI